MRRYLSLAAFYLYLFCTIAYGHRAHAEEPVKLMAEPDALCMTVVNELVPQVHALFTANTSPALIRYMILTDPEMGDSSRWLLLKELDAMETLRAFGKRMSQSDAIELGTIICRLPQPGAVPKQSTGGNNPEFDMHNRGA